MPFAFATASAASAIPIAFASTANWDAISKTLSAEGQRFAAATGFAAKPGKCLLVPSPDGAIAQVIFGVEEEAAKSRDPFRVGALPGLLPAGTYRFANPPHDARLAALAFALGSYRFARYRKADNPDVRLVPPEGVDAAELARMADAAFLARDLINTPASDLGPAEIEAAARALAARHGAAVEVIVGDALIERNFPLIHAVGRASDRAPRLIDIAWGRKGARRVTLVGKGITFDTGGLDIKPSSGMLLMKKDMGGAATVLALGHMIMGQRLDVELRILIPSAENSIAGNAFRPSDVIRSRDGRTVEIGNTDAEGRLVLADALAYAGEGTGEAAGGAGDVLVFATLTGAARVALGPDLPAFFTDDDGFAARVGAAGERIGDPVWRMPLWPGYERFLDSEVADMNNVYDAPFAGAVTAALFLRRFARNAARFAHFDLYGWRPAARPLGPKGGEPQTARAVFEALKQECGR